MELPSLKIPSTFKYFQQLEFPYKYGLYDYLFRSYLSKKGICWFKTPEGLMWKLDMNMAPHRWIVYGSYDFQFLRWAKKNIPADGVVVDSGANIGQMTLYFGGWQKNGKILAFEPSLEASRWISDCIEKNTCDNIELIKKGLGAESSDAILVDKGKQFNRDIHSFWSYISNDGKLPGENIVITRLDAELAERDIKEVDLWKLDVEGFELQALEGAKDLIKAHKIKAIYAELAIKEDNHIKIRDFLSKYGYSCYYFDRAGKLIKSKKIPDHQTNGLFLPG